MPSNRRLALPGTVLSAAYSPVPDMTGRGDFVAGDCGTSVNYHAICLYVGKVPGTTELIESSSEICSLLILACYSLYNIQQVFLLDTPRISKFLEVSK